MRPFSWGVKRYAALSGFSMDLSEDLFHLESNQFRLDEYYNYPGTGIRSFLPWLG